MAESSRQEQIKSLLMDALDRTPIQRERFVHSVADDASMCAEVLDLIQAHERAGEFMNDPGPSSGGRPSTFNSVGRADEEAVGSVIDRYELVQLIGEGGFGLVYRARQREPVVREVALKIIKLGMDTKQVIARFEAERQALAVMEHPGIARVIDAGATVAGRPYFVMELVDGQPVTAFCDENRLSVEARLELFTHVCEAVHHAHMKGVIHRDIKPSNVLVARLDGHSVPKVIDFGIAKATGGDHLPISADQPNRGEFKFTMDCTLVGTPAYMSPEQAALAPGADIDTRADVYSLGVLLYELLTGVTPFDEDRLRSSTIDEFRRILREEPPPKPSTRLSATSKRALGSRLSAIGSKRRSESHQPTAGLVRGDLDWITLKALEKDRDLRYSSAAEFADDVKRHLSHEPVLASPPSTMYRMKKFVRRHRVGVLASCLIALAVMCGAVGLTVGMVQARVSAEKARDAAQQAQAVNDFMREILTRVKPEKDGADVRLFEVMDNASKTASQRFAGHPLLEAQVRDLLGGVYNDLAMWNKAKFEYKWAMDLWRDHVGAEDARTIWSERMYIYGAINNQQVAEVASRLPDLLARTQRHFGPNDLATLDVQRSIGRVHAQQGRHVEAERVFLDIRARLLAYGDDDALQFRILKDLIFLRRSAAQNPDNVGQNQAMLSELEALARERVERAIRAHGVESTNTMDARIGLAQILADQGQYHAAAQVCRTVLDAASTRLGECHSLQMEALDVMAFVAHRLGDSATAADLDLKLIACDRQFGAPIMLISRISDALPILDRGERWVEGEALAREYAQSLQTMGGGHADVAFDAEVWVARFVSLQGRSDEAEAMLQSLLNRPETIALGKFARARMHLFHGSNLCRLGAFEESELELQTAADVMGDSRMGTHWANPDDILFEFIALYNAWGKPAMAEEYQAMREQTLANLPIDPS